MVGANAAALGQNPNITPALGINLAQALITPTITYKFNDDRTIGFGPVIGWQRFRAYGLGLFQAFSDRPDKVTNNGNDNSVGYGARIGYQGTIGMFPSEQLRRRRSTWISSTTMPDCLQSRAILISRPPLAVALRFTSRPS